MADAISISEMRVHIVDLPVAAVHSHGSGDISSIRTVILELGTDAGITGWGEASPWPVFTGTVEANVAALHTYYRPHVIGANALQVSRMLARAEGLVVGCTEARAALESALLDVVGKSCSLSVSELVGGRHRDTMPLSFSVANPDFDEDLDTVAELYEDGVRIFKIKTGFADHAFDLTRLEELRKRYGTKLDLRVDYNQGMKPFEAIRRLRDLEQFGLTFIEQPVPRQDLEAMAAIARALDTPLMADESVFDARDALAAIAIGAADIFSLKIMKSGGIRSALNVAAIARAAGVEVYGGCMFESGIAHTAGVHLCAALAELSLGCEFYMANYYLKEDLLTEPFDVSNGHVHVPQAPGLGVQVDRDRLRKYTLEVLG